MNLGQDPTHFVISYICTYIALALPPMHSCWLLSLPALQMHTFKCMECHTCSEIMVQQHFNNMATFLVSACHDLLILARDLMVTQCIFWYITIFFLGNFSILIVTLLYCGIHLIHIIKLHTCNIICSVCTICKLHKAMNRTALCPILIHNVCLVHLCYFELSLVL